MSVLIQSLFNTSEALSTRDISAAIVSSVVPSLTRIMVGMAKTLFNVSRRVGPGLKTGMPIRYEDPREAYADRIVNAVAAYERWPEGLVIVDFGTATTFDVVNPGDYLGGSICPGIGISSRRFLSMPPDSPRRICKTQTRRWPQYCRKYSIRSGLWLRWFIRRPHQAHP